jgi:hypothetical protein
VTRFLPAAVLLLLSGCSSVCRDVLQGEWRPDGRCDGWFLSMTVPL